MPTTERITPCLCFDGQAEQAASFYVSLFKNARITSISRYGDAGPGPKGSVMAVAFELDGQSFLAINGVPTFKFTEAISMMINCDTQAEVDHYWGRLTADGGQPIQCGWLKDKFGVFWQVTPKALMEMMMSGGEPAKTQRAMAAMMQMVKLDIAALKSAYDGA
jgi:predicted 3-demethylubiquinone-9 3-methyltransferase (glyoxalase superfamily)